jgi:hypothetical protein
MLEVELVAEYLLENSYVSSERDAYEFIPHMSDEWLSLVIEEVLNEETSLFNLITEMRREDKERGKKPHGLYIKSDKKRVLKTPEGKLQVVRDKDVLNPYAALGRGKQGMRPNPKQGNPETYRKHITDPTTQRRHPQGGGEAGVDAGYARGVKKVKGAKYRNTSYTPVELIKQRLAANRRRKSEQGRFNRNPYL